MRSVKLAVYTTNYKSMCTLEKYSLPIAMISPTQNISLYKTRLKYLQMYKKKYRGTTSSISKRYHVQTMYLQGLIVFSVTEFTCNHTLFFCTLKKELPLFFTCSCQCLLFEANVPFCQRYYSPSA